MAKDPPPKPSVPPAPRSAPAPRTIPPATPRSTRPLPMRPTKLGRFDVLAKIAGGGMASIWLGRATAASREMVGLKVMRSDRAEEDEELVKMFVDEANLLARLHRPAIVRTIEVGVDGGQRYIAMELLLGMTLMSIFTACT